MVGNKALSLPKFDWILVGTTLFLVIIGLSTLQSTVLAGGEEKATLVSRQILAFVIGLSGAIFLSLLDYRYFYFLSPLFYLISIFLLGLVLVYGKEIRGATRWFMLGTWMFQPSEIVKIFLAISWASLLAWARRRWGELVSILFSFISALIPCVLVFLEPDLGTSLILGFVWLGILLGSGVDFKIMLTLGFLFIFALPLGWTILNPYQKQRVFSFVDPYSDPLGSGYNLIQAVIAVGSGQFLGRGWGRGTQSHLRFLPDQYTDFIFATFSEEIGFVGAAILLLVFGLFFWRGISIIGRAADGFGRMIACGIVSLLFIQFGINVGMNIGLLPIAGIPLPFVSYGGNALITALTAVGILESVARKSCARRETGI